MPLLIGQTKRRYLKMNLLTVNDFNPYYIQGLKVYRVYHIRKALNKTRGWLEGLVEQNKDLFHVMNIDLAKNILGDDFKSFPPNGYMFVTEETAKKILNHYQ